MVCLARDNLLAVLEAVCPYSLKFSYDELVPPYVSHSISTLFSSSSHTPVGESGRLGYSPYLCPFIGTKYNKNDAVQYLRHRADRRPFLCKLSGRSLICDCCFHGGDCWAQILQHEFCLEFNLARPESMEVESNSDDSDGTDGERPERNADVISSGLQPTRHKLPQLIEDGCEPDEHLQRALLLEITTPPLR